MRLTLLMRSPYTIREHEPFQAGEKLTAEDLKSLHAIWRESATPDRDGAVSPVFSRTRDGALTANNYVGVLTARRQTAIEILSKIDFGDRGDTDHRETKTHFLKMLRSYRGLRRAAQLPESSIQELRRFPMLEVFVRQFLENLQVLVRGGLARRDVSVEENLPHLRGCILFPEQIRENLANQARFFVAHDELSVNRPANRLIHKARTMLGPQVHSGENRQLLRELTAAFAATRTRSIWPARDRNDIWPRITAREYSKRSPIFRSQMAAAALCSYWMPSGKRSTPRNRTRITG